MSSIKRFAEGVSFPQGFLTAAVRAGIKEKGNDLGLLFSEVPCSAVGFFTRNNFKAESLLVTERHLRSGSAQAIVVISGNANCANGQRGLDDARLICSKIAKSFKIKTSEVLIASTGKIGIPLPIAKIKRHIPRLVKGISDRGSLEFAQAIMTTDTFPKQCAYLVADRIKIGACAKGAGMISPELATMLCFITTDAKINPLLLKDIVAEAIDKSFNRISVDSEQSTNDTLLCLANGCSQIKVKKGSSLYRYFKKALESALRELSLMIVKDGEGASCVVKIAVLNAPSKLLAEKVARRIAASCLFRASLSGRQPNWGRLISALGTIEPPLGRNIDIYYGNIKVVSCGKSSYQKMDRVRQYLKENNEFLIRIDLKRGKKDFYLYTTDLTPKYVELNQC